MRAKRAELRHGETIAILRIESRLAHLSTLQQRRDAAAVKFAIAEARLQELERLDDHRHGGDTPQACADSYLVAFAGSLAWRFKCRSEATGAFEGEDGIVDADAFRAERHQELQAYLSVRFPSATRDAIERAAAQPRERGLTNFRLTSMMEVTRVEHDALGLVHLKWSDASVDEVVAELKSRKLGRDRQRRHEKARASGKPTIEERSRDSIAELARQMGKSRRSIERWISLGALSAKIDRVAVSAPQRDIWRALSATIEARRTERARCAPASPAEIPPEPSSDFRDDPLSPPSHPAYRQDAQRRVTR